MWEKPEIKQSNALVIEFFMSRIQMLPFEPQLLSLGCGKREQRMRGKAAVGE